MSNIFTNPFGGIVSQAGSTALTTLVSPGSSFQPSNNGGIALGDSLAGANARSDPQLSFTWYAQLPVITPGSTQNAAGASSTSILQNLASAASGAVLSTVSSALGGAIPISNSAQLPWYYVEEATLPFRRYDVKSIFREGRDRHYPSKYNIDDLRLSIYADSNNIAITYLQAWNNAILTPFNTGSVATMGGGWGRPSDYKKSIFIYVLDPTNYVLNLIEYSECWPVSIDQYQMDSATSTRIVNHVNFSVGDVFVNVMPTTALFMQQLLTNPLNNVITGTISGAVSGAASALSSFL